MCHLLTKNVFQRCGKEAQFGRHRLFSSENSKARISKSTPRRVYIVGINPAYLVLFYHCLKFGDRVFYHPVSAKINIARNSLGNFWDLLETLSLLEYGLTLLYLSPKIVDCLILIMQFQYILILLLINLKFYLIYSICQCRNIFKLINVPKMLP